MFSFYSFVFLTLLYNCNCKDVFLPSYIQPCNLQDSDFSKCVKNQIDGALPQFTKGIPEMDVPSIDPVQLSDIQINANGLNLSFSDAAMYGLSKSSITDLEVRLGKGEETFSLSFKADLSLIAQYVIDGRILILPIQGHGDAVVKALGVRVNINSKFHHTEDKIGEHLKLASPKYNYTIEKTVFDLKNLFNGNEELGATTLQFANENWEQLMDELSPPAIQQIVKSCIKAINKFFSKVSIEQIILGYDRH